MNDDQEIEMVFVDSEGRQRICMLTVSDHEPWTITIKSQEFNEKKFNGRDLFDCLISARLFLEKNNYLLLCGGARIDVYPSGMSRDMSGGRLAYVTKIGVGASREDIVDIFEPANQTNIGTVEQQKEFHARWVSSIKDVE